MLSKIWQDISRWYRWAEITFPKIIVLILSVLTLILLALFQYQLKHIFNEIFTQEPANFWEGMVLILNLIAFWDYPTKAYGYLGAAVVSGGMAYLFFLLLYRMRYQIYDLKISKTHRSDARRVIVMNLSVPRSPEQKENFKSNLKTYQQLSLQEAKNSKVFFQWQQNLRVLHHHLKDELQGQYGRLATFWQLLPWVNKEKPQRHVVILPSEEGCNIAAGYEQKGRVYIDLFIGLATQCINNSGAEIQGRMPEFHKEAGVDYDDLEEQDMALRKLIHDIRISDEIHAKPYEISIDATSGTKQSSIAAAAVTFASAIEFTHLEQGTNELAAFDVIASLKKGD